MDEYISLSCVDAITQPCPNCDAGLINPQYFVKYPIMFHFMLYHLCGEYWNHANSYNKVKITVKMQPVCG